MSEITGHKYLARALAAAGVTHVFMVPTIIVPALAEMDACGIVGIMAHGEKAAAYMADGYARLIGRPGFAFAQTVGAANLAAGLRDGYLAHSPIIAMTGGTTPMSRGRGVYQEIEDFPLYHQVTKYNAHLEDVRRLPDLLRQCFRAATTGAPGPVHLDLQGSIGNVLLDSLDPATEYGPAVEPAFLTVPAQRLRPPADALPRVAALIERADRPVLVLGGGARISGAGAAAMEVARRGQVPIATSLNAKGICDESDPLVVGVVGASSRKPANQTVERADLVVFVGSATGTQVTDTWRLPKPGTTVVQIDIDPEQLGRNYPNEVSVQADARVALEELAAVIGPHVEHQEWLRETRDYVMSWRAEVEALLGSDDRPIRPERLCRELTEFLPSDGVLVVDTGHSGIWTAGLIDLRPGQDLIRAAGSLGWSFPAAIGAKCAAPDRTVVCLTGDGGFYYHLAEVETAVRHGIAPIIVVNDNVTLSQDAKVFRSAWGGKVSERGELMWRFTDVDLADVAARLGAFTVRVEKPEDIAPALSEARAADRIAIVDVVTDTEAFPPVPHGGRDFYSTAGQS